MTKTDFIRTRIKIYVLFVIMNFIFCKLPDDIIKNILLYNDHFIMRKGEMVSIIPKKDYRYKLLKYITFKLDRIQHLDNHRIIYNYFFLNLYYYEGRHISNSDLIQVILQEDNNTIKYFIWIGKQYPKSVICNKPQNYYIENPSEYNWIYTVYEYIRR